MVATSPDPGPIYAEIYSRAQALLTNYARKQGITLSDEQDTALRDSVSDLIEIKPIPPSLWSRAFDAALFPFAYLTALMRTLLGDGYILELERAGKRGKSKWIGHIRHNSTKVLESLARAAVDQAGKLPPWALIVVVFYALRDIRRATEIELGDVEASIVYVIWLRRDRFGYYREADTLQDVNELRSRHSRSPINEAMLDEALKWLKKHELIAHDEHSGSLYLLDEVVIKR